MSKRLHFKGGDTLGICLGMQILYKSSEEDKDINGIGIIKKLLKKLIGPVKIMLLSHIGWNKVIYYKEIINDELFKIIKGKSFIFHIVLQKNSLKKKSALLTLFMEKISIDL